MPPCSPAPHAPSPIVRRPGAQPASPGERGRRAHHRSRRRRLSSQRARNDHSFRANSVGRDSADAPGRASARTSLGGPPKRPRKARSKVARLLKPEANANLPIVRRDASGAVSVLWRRASRRWRTYLARRCACRVARPPGLRKVRRGRSARARRESPQLANHGRCAIRAPPLASTAMLERAGTENRGLRHGPQARSESHRRAADRGRLFFLHHGVGSEDWSADGFVRRG